MKWQNYKRNTCNPAMWCAITLNIGKYWCNILIYSFFSSFFFFKRYRLQQKNTKQQQFNDCLPSYLLRICSTTIEFRFFVYCRYCVDWFCDRQWIQMNSNGRLICLNLVPWRKWCNDNWAHRQPGCRRWVRSPLFHGEIWKACTNRCITSS